MTVAQTKCTCLSQSFSASFIYWNLFFRSEFQYFLNTVTRVSRPGNRHVSGLCGCKRIPQRLLQAIAPSLLCRLPTCITLIPFFSVSFREDEHDGLGETVLDLPSWIHLPIAQYSACSAQQDTVVSEFNTPFCVFSSMCLSMDGIIPALSAVCPSTAPSQIMPTLCVKAWMLPSAWPRSPRSQTWLRSSGLLEECRFTR